MRCRKRFRHWLLGLLVPCVAAFLIGCAPTETSGVKKYRLAVIPKGETHDFWKSIHAGAIAAARELGNVEVVSVFIVLTPSS